MGKSSPTKLQLKHIPDVVIMQTVFTIQNTWTVWLGGVGDLDTITIFDLAQRVVPARSMHFRQKHTAHLSEICETLKPLPEKLIWKKLQKLEDKGWLEGYGPSGTHYKVSDRYWESVE